MVILGVVINETCYKMGCIRTCYFKVVVYSSFVKSESVTNWSITNINMFLQQVDNLALARKKQPVTTPSKKLPVPEKEVAAINDIWTAV